MKPKSPSKIKSKNIIDKLSFEEVNTLLIDRLQMSIYLSYNENKITTISETKEAYFQAIVLTRIYLLLGDKFIEDYEGYYGSTLDEYLKGLLKSWTYNGNVEYIIEEKKGA